MSMTPLPDAPARGDDPDVFVTKADAFVAALPAFVTEANALATQVSTDATTASTSASAASTSAISAASSATAAQSASNATKWISGTTYAQGDVVWSPATFLSYRRKTNGAGTTDPSADTTNWQSLIPTPGRPSVTGQTGSTSTTTLSLSANVVSLANSAGDVVTKYNTGSKTLDITVAGPAAGGRDQSGSILNSWTHVYWIYNPTTAALALLVSTTAPSSFTGSTLPSGYTYWAYATSIYVDGSPAFRSCSVYGSRVDYANPVTILNAQAATTFTAVDCSLYVSPNALRGRFSFSLNPQHTSTGAFNMTVRPTGSGSSGFIAAAVRLPVSGQVAESVNWGEMPMGTSSQIDYQMNAAPATSGGASIKILGYTVPNGDA